MKPMPSTWVHQDQDTAASLKSGLEVQADQHDAEWMSEYRQALADASEWT
jgi:LPS sulfotransferase NodH